MACDVSPVAMFFLATLVALHFTPVSKSLGSSFELAQLRGLRACSTFFVNFFNFCLTYPYQRPPCGPQSGTEKYEEGKSIFSFLNIVVMLHACYHSLHMYQQIQFAEKCCYGDHIILVITYISKVLTTLQFLNYCCCARCIICYQTFKVACFYPKSICTGVEAEQ